MCSGGGSTRGSRRGWSFSSAPRARRVFHEAFGARQLIRAGSRRSGDTVYDVASLTKAVATTVLAMQEVGAGRLALDARAAELVPELGGAEREAITVRQLLASLLGPSSAPAVLEAGGPSSPPNGWRSSSWPRASRWSIRRERGRSTRTSGSSSSAGCSSG